MIELDALRPEPDRRGHSPAAVSHDHPAVLARFRRKNGVQCRLRSDEGSRTIRAFGIRSPDYPPGHFAHGVPQPVIYVIDRPGRAGGEGRHGPPDACGDPRRGGRRRPLRPAATTALDRSAPRR